MERKKTEQIILIALIPIFLFSLLYMRVRGAALVRESYDIGSAAVTIEHDKRIEQIPKPDGVLEVRYEGGSKDPMKDLLQAYLDEQRLEGKPGEGAKEVVSLPELTIEGLIWNSNMPQAIINGKVLKIGDSIEGVEIVNIDKEGITVKHEGRTVFVSKR